MPEPNTTKESTIKTDDKMLNEQNLIKAVAESLETNSCLPLLKQELRCKIQFQRLEKGKSELKVEFPEPPKYQLREEEILKRNKRRMQNRQSAVRCRQKLKYQEQDLLNEITALEDKNFRLRKDTVDLERQRDVLEKCLHRHNCKKHQHAVSTVNRGKGRKLVSLLNRQIIYSAA